MTTEACACQESVDPHVCVRSTSQATDAKVLNIVKEHETQSFQIQYLYRICAIFLWHFLERIRLTWQDARQFCLDNGGRLYEPRTQEDFDEAESARDEVGSPIWLGGTDLTTEGTWKWDSDGSTAVRNGFWTDGERENDEVHQDCMILFQSGIGDYQCWLLLSFLCNFN